MLHVPSDFLFSRLHEQEERFKPSLSTFDFQYFLYNMTDLQISNAGGRNCECATVSVQQLAWEFTPANKDEIHLS